MCKLLNKLEWWCAFGNAPCGMEFLFDLVLNWEIVSVFVYFGRTISNIRLFGISFHSNPQVNGSGSGSGRVTVWRGMVWRGVWWRSQWQWHGQNDMHTYNTPTALAMPMAKATKEKQVNNAQPNVNQVSYTAYEHRIHNRPYIHTKPAGIYGMFTFHVWSEAYLFKCYLNGSILIHILIYIYWCALKSKKKREENKPKKKKKKTEEEKEKTRNSKTTLDHIYVWRLQTALIPCF